MGSMERVSPELLALARCAGEDVFVRLETSSRGLSADEVSARRDRWGINRVAHEEHRPVLMQLVGRLVDPLNILLLSLATLSMLTGDRQSPVMIFLMVLLSVSLSIVQEHRSSKAAQKLQAMVHTTTAVLRQSSWPASAQSPDPAVPQEIAIEQLVPGDIVHLSAGDMVPADLRVIAAKDLFINQSVLTGESLPAEKHAQPVTTATSEIENLTNICFMGTSVVSGTATAVVVLTGRRAYFGGVAEIIARRRAPTSFDKGISRFAWLMVRFILVMAPLVFLINGFTQGDWLQALLFATAVAVGLTPEMLPMIVTVNLAKGALAMSQLRVIVKRLNAIQNFGAMDVLCTDKTGTLT